MRINWATTGKYFLLFLLGLALLYLAFRGQDMSALWREISQANLTYVALSAALVVLANILRAWRWQLLFESIHYRVSLRNSFSAVMVGYLANLALPRIGEVTRCTALLRSERVPVYASLGTVVTERLFDVAVLFITLSGMLLFQYPLVGTFMEHLAGQLFARLEAGSFLLPVLLLLVLICLGAGLWYVRRKRNRAFLRIALGLRDGFFSFHRMKRKTTFILLSAGIWFCYLFSIYTALFAIPSTSALGMDAAYTAMVFSGLAMVAPVQGGIGVFHWMVGQALVCYKIAFADGLAYATIIHSSQMLLILLIGSLALAHNLSSVGGEPKRR